MDIDEECRSLEKKQAENSLLNVVADGEKILEILAPNYRALFYALCEWKEIEISTLFDNDGYENSEGKFIDARGIQLRYQDIYQKADLEQPIRSVSFGSRVGQKIVYTTSVPSLTILALTAFQEQDCYLSFSNLFYRDMSNNLWRSPLFFLRVKITRRADKFWMKCLSDGPIFNETLIRYVRDYYNVDLTFDKYSFDLYDYVSFISHKVSNLLWGVDEGCYLGAFEILESNRECRILNLGSRLSAHQPVRGLDKPNCESPEKVFSGVAVETLDQNGIVGLAIADSKLKEAVFRKIIVRALKAGKKTLVVGDSKLFKSTIEALNLDAAVNPYSSFNNIKTLQESFSLRSNLELKLEFDQEKHRELNEFLENFLMLEEEKIGMTIPTGESLMGLTAAVSELSAKTTHPLEIDLSSDYGPEDYQSDRDCLEVLDQSPSIKKGVLSAHPFYGLEAEENEETYEKIKEIITRITSDLAMFVSKAKDIAANSSGFMKIDKIRDFDEYENHLELFVGYTGFPTRYFNFDDDEKLLTLLAGAKNGLFVLGSLKLSVENLTAADFFETDWLEVFERAQKKDHKALRFLKSRLKVKDRRSLKSLLLLLENYCSNKSQTDAFITALEKDYELHLNGIDDIIAVEEAMAYVDEFVRHARLYDSIDFHCEFVDRIFADQAFRQQLKDDILPELQALRYKIDADLDEYREFNPHDYNDYTDITFDELEHAFDSKNDADYREFSEYCHFSLKLKDASQHLKDYVNEYCDYELPLETMSVDYLYSLYSCIFRRFTRAYGGSDTWIKSEEKALTTLSGSGNIIDKHELSSFVDQFNAAASKDELRRTEEELKSLTRVCRIFNSAFMCSRYQNTLADFFPLSFCDPQEVYAFAKVRYDLVVAVDAEKMTPAQFLNTVLLGREVVTIQTADYPVSFPLKMGFDRLIGGEIYRKSHDLLQELFADVRGSYQVGFDVRISESDSLPLVLTRTGGSKPSFVLLPDLIYLEHPEYLSVYIRELPRMIGDCLGLTPIIVNTSELALAADKSLYLRHLIDGHLSMKLLKTSKPSVKTRKAVPESSDRRKYLERLTEIYNSFEAYPTPNEIQTLLDEKDYRQLFDRLAPLNSTKLMGFGKEFCQYVLEQQERGEVTLRADRFYVRPDQKIKVRKSLAEQRSSEDISVDEMVRAAYTYLLNFSYLKISVLVNEMVHIFGVNAEDPIFVETYQKALQYLVDKGYASSSDGRISLNL